MPTIESSIEAALFARVASFSASPALPVAWPNVSFTAPSRYLRVTHIPNANERLFLNGSDPHRRFGLLQLSVFTDKNKGSAAATELAGQVAAHFPADLPMRRGGLTVRVERAPDIAQAIPEDAHWHVPVTVRYEVFA
jgi:hypothetical protein